MIKAIVFDFDGMVFITKEFFSDRLNRDFGINKDDIIEFFKTEFDDCKRGKLDMKEVLEGKYLQKWKWNKSIDELFEYWFSDGVLNQEMINLISELKKKGIKCILCTSNEKHRMDYVNRKFGFNEIFDEIVYSFEVGELKPDKAIFDAILDKSGFVPEEILYCDDKEKNVDYGKKLGFKVHLFKDFEEFKRDLLQFLVTDCI